MLNKPKPKGNFVVGRVVQGFRRVHFETLNDMTEEIENEIGEFGTLETVGGYRSLVVSMLYDFDEVLEYLGDLEEWHEAK